jgi:hypothetical protein
VNEAGLAKFKKLAAEIEQLRLPQNCSSDDRWIASMGWNEEDQKVLRTIPVMDG